MKRYFRFSFVLPILLGIFLFLSCKEESNTNVPLDSSTDQISGIVTDAQGYGVPMADVQLMNDSFTVFAQTSTDEDGAYTIANPPAKSNLKLKISHPDYKEDYENIEKFPNKKNCPVSIYRNDSCCGKIDFTLLDSNTGAPINLAEIRINKNQNIYKKIKTNDLGKASFLNVCPGIYSIRISRENYNVYETIVQINNCDSVKVIKNLLKKVITGADTCCNNKLKIIARDSATGLYLKGANIRITNQNFIQVLENKDGGVLFNNLCKGLYSVRIAKEGYKVQEFTLELNCSDSLYFAKYLSKVYDDSCCNAKIRIFARDSSNNADLTNYKVTLFNGNLSFGTKTSQANPLVFEHLCPGKYTYVISKEGFKTREVTFELKCNENKESAIKLFKEFNDSCCNSNIKVSVKDQANNTDILNATIKIYKANQLLGEYKNQANPFVFQKLCPGSYNFTVMKDGYKPIEFSVSIGCNETKESQANLTKIVTDTCCKGKIKVWLKDSATGADLINAQFKLWKDGAVISTKGSQVNPIVFENLCSGNYGLNITREGYKGSELSVIIACNEVKEITKSIAKIPLDSCCNNIISVRTRDSATSANINEVLVKLWKGSAIIKDGKTNAEGRLVFSGICKGSYTIAMAKDGYKGKEFNLTVNCGDSLNFEKFLPNAMVAPCSTAKLVLSIKDSTTKTYLQGAEVTIYKGNTIVYSTSSPAQGTVVKEALTAPETYTVVVSKTGYNTISRNFVFSECKTITETIWVTK